MAEATPVNVVAFEPYNGGQGAQISVSSVSASVAIPGLAGGQQDDRSRVVVSNGGSVSAFIHFGPSGVTAGTSSLEILPGTKETLKPPYIGPNAIYLAAVTASGSTTINVCAGLGT
jgi:hypothetical protein